MAWGVALVVVGILIAAVWIFIEIKRLRHKMFAIFLIAFILFVYITATMTFKGKDVDFGSVSGIMKAGSIYFSWLKVAFLNFGSITSNAIKMDWSGDSAVVNETGKRQ